MVEMNLFARQEERCEHREWVCGHRVVWDELGDWN